MMSDKENKWLKDTKLAEDKLLSYNAVFDPWYIHIGTLTVSLEGEFTPAELREIADVCEERINAAR